ncbi:MAG: DUF4412 domain-containing protein [Cytophaga sp.]|uniref:DUF4412 domain-containing protein n=1 Tax=Cytophaga sp. TaxID=29535 RepID=UPI003F813C34
MKYLYLLSFLFAVTSVVSAQTKPFEGTMTWTCTTDVIDSKEVEKYQKQIIREDNSEINQSIAELEQQLNDPEMQYLLLENPTVKSNMQKRLNDLKATQAANLESENNAKNIFPTSLVIYLKNNNSYTKIEGGSLAKLTGNMLYLDSTETTYFIKDDIKTYAVLSDSTNMNRYDSIISITKTTDSVVILKRPCVKYILVTKEDSEINTSYIWITKSIPSMNDASFRSIGFVDGNLHHEAFVQFEGGIPLKIVIFEKGFQLSMEVSDISPSLLADSLFTIPAKYKHAVWGY